MTNDKAARLLLAGCDEKQVKNYFRYQKERKQGKTPAPAIRQNYHYCNGLLEQLEKEEERRAKDTTKWFQADSVLDNPEIPKGVQISYLKIQERLENQGLKPLKGVFLMPEKISLKPSWWAWDSNENGRWFTAANTPAKVNPKADHEGDYYFSAVSTYARRVDKGLPLYTNR